MLGVAGGLGRGHGHKRGAPGTAPAGGGQRGAAGPAAPGSRGAEPALHGLARRCWRGGCGAQRGAPMQRPQPRCCPPVMGSPNPAGLRGQEPKVSTPKVSTPQAHTHCWGGETGRGASNPTVCLQPQLPPCWAPTTCSPPWARPSREEVEAMGSRPAARHHGCGALCCASSPSATVPAGIGSPPRVPSCSTRAPGGPAAAPHRHPPSPSLASWWGRASPGLQPRAPGPGLWGAGIQEAPKPPSVAARSTWAPHRPSLRAVGGPLCPQGPNRFLRG